MLRSLECLLICCLIFVSGKGKAQEITVLSLDDKSPVPSATVILRNCADNKELVLISDIEGKLSLASLFNQADSKNDFTFPVAIIISYIGFEKINDTIFNSNNKTYLLTPKSVMLNEKVITAQYAPGSIEKSVYKIEVIDREKIDAMAATNLKDVLNNQMNIRISQDQILGSGMSMQGISGENVKIMIDGVPVIGRQNGNIDLSQINLNDVERIEIVEGPLSVNYGTNALAGTVNIVTKKSQEKRIDLSINSYAESIGTFDFDGTASMRFGLSRISASGGRNFFDGWNSTDKFNTDFARHYADSSRFKSWKPREQYFGRMQYNYTFKNILFGYKGEIFNEKITNYGYPRAPYLETAFDDYYFTNRKDHSVYGNGQVSKNKNINFVAAFNDYLWVKNTFYKDLTTLEKTLTTTEGDQDTSRFQQYMSRGSFSKSAQNAFINYEMGYDINFETAEGKRIQNEHQQMGDYAGFISTEINPEKHLLIRPGVRYGYNSMYNSPIIPSLNIKLIKKNFTLRMSYAKGFRAPSLKELDFYFVDINHHILGNPDLKAEYSNNYTANLNFKKLFGETISQSELNLFYNDISNLITLAQTTGAEYSYINIGRHKTIGCGINESLIFKTIKTNAGIGYSGTYDQNEENSFSGRFGFSPEAKFNVTYSPHSSVSISVFYSFLGRIPVFTSDAVGNVKTSFSESYQLADATISKSLSKKRIILACGVKNIFNVQNINSGGASGGAHSSGDAMVPLATGRFVFTKISFSFSK